MTTASTPGAASPIPTEDELLQAFRMIDLRIARELDPGPLLVLRRRLAGELLGEADLVDSTLAPDFEVVTIAGGRRTVIDRASVVAAIARPALPSSGALIWVELAGLLCDGDAIAAHGDLRTLRQQGSTGADSQGDDADHIVLTTMPVALFLSLRANLMTAETVYLDDAAARTETLPPGPMPSADALRTLLDPDGEYRCS